MLDYGNRLVVLSETDPNGPHIQSLIDIHVQLDDTAHNACSCDRNKNMLVVYDPPTCMHQPKHPTTPCNKWWNEGVGNTHPMWSTCQWVSVVVLSEPHIRWDNPPVRDKVCRMPRDRRNKLHTLCGTGSSLRRLGGDISSDGR